MFNFFDSLDDTMLRTARIEDAFQRGLSRVRLKAGKMDDTPMELLGAQKVGCLANMSRLVATQTCFIFTPIPGEMMQFDAYFSNGLKPPSRCNLYHFDDWYDLQMKVY